MTEWQGIFSVPIAWICFGIVILAILYFCNKNVERLEGSQLPPAAKPGPVKVVARKKSAFNPKITYGMPSKHRPRSYYAQLLSYYRRLFKFPFPRYTLDPDPESDSLKVRLGFYFMHKCPTGSILSSTRRNRAKHLRRKFA